MLSKLNVWPRLIHICIEPDLPYAFPSVQVRLISFAWRQGQVFQDAHVKRYDSYTQAQEGRWERGYSKALIVHIHGGGFVAQSSLSHEVCLSSSICLLGGRDSANIYSFYRLFYMFSVCNCAQKVYLRMWAKQTGIPIVSIDYSLAPEHKYPRAVHEYVIRWSFLLETK